MGAQSSSVTDPFNPGFWQPVIEAGGAMWLSWVGNPTMHIWTSVRHGIMGKPAILPFGYCLIPRDVCALNFQIIGLTTICVPHRFQQGIVIPSNGIYQRFIKHKMALCLETC